MYIYVQIHSTVAERVDALAFHHMCTSYDSYIYIYTHIHILYAYIHI